MSRRLPLRGRDAALDHIADLVVQARAGTSALLVVHGAAGMGKTRLLEEAAAMSARYGVPATRAAAVAGERLVPLAPFRDALRGVAAGPELLARLEGGTPVARTGEPHVVCLDDLQWADEMTLAALGTLPAPLAVVAAVDPGRASAAALAALRRASATVTLGPLDETMVVRLARDVLGAPPDPALHELLRQARGVPGELTPFLLGLAEEERVVTRDGRCRLVADGFPARMHSRLRDRLDALTPLGRQVAIAAAVLGPEGTAQQLAAMVERPAAHEPAGELIAAGLGERTAGGGVRLLGVATRDLLLQALPRPTLSALQRQAAGLLADGGASPLAVAELLLAGARPGDGRVARTLLAASRSLLESDPAKGADLCRRALELAGPDDPVRGELAATAVRLMHADDRAADAQGLAARWAQDLATPTGCAAVLLEASELFALSADVRAEANRRALALDGVDPVHRARHLARLGANLAVAGRVDEAQQHLDAVGPAVADAGDPRADSALAFAETALDNARGRYERALHPPAPSAWTDNVHSDSAAFLRCGTLLTVGRLQAALAMIEAGVTAAAAARQRWAARMWGELRLRVLLALGRPLEVLAAAGTTLAGPVPAIVPEAAALAAVATAAIHAGDTRTIRACAATARAAVTGGAPEVRRHAAWVVLRCAEASGDPAPIAGWSTPPQGAALPRLAPSSADAVVLTRLALAAGEPELARHTAALAGARALLSPGSGYLSALAAHAAALVADRPRGLAEAAARLGEAGAVLAEASALEDLGQLSVRSPATRADGIGQLDAALARYERAGAERDGARVRRRLRREAERRRPSAPAAAPGDLTAAERRVVDLVASGLTNRQVAERLSISSNTVGTHLRHAFAKLGVSSRRELVLRALRAEGE